MRASLTACRRAVSAEARILLCQRFRERLLARRQPTLQLLHLRRADIDLALRQHRALARFRKLGLELLRTIARRAELRHEPLPCRLAHLRRCRKLGDPPLELLAHGRKCLDVATQARKLRQLPLDLVEIGGQGALGLFELHPQVGRSRFGRFTRIFDLRPLSHGSVAVGACGTSAKLAASRSRSRGR